MIEEDIRALIDKLDTMADGDPELWGSRAVALLVDEGIILLPEEVGPATIGVLVKCIRVGWGENGDYHHGYSPVRLKVGFWKDFQDFPRPEHAEMIWEGIINGPTTIEIPPPPAGRTYQFHATWDDGVWHKRTPLLPAVETDTVTAVNITHIDR